MTLESVLFHHSFEDGFDATMARGHAEPAEIIGEPQIVPGRDGGKALKLRNGLDAVGFDLPENFNPEQGAISFWLSSGGNWDGSMPNLLQILFHTNEGDAGHRMVLQSIWHHRGLAMISYANGQIVGGFPDGTHVPRAPLWLAEDAASVLQAGQWYHYLYTWRDGHVVVYQNGVQVAHFTHPGLRFRDLGERFYLGWKKDADAKVTSMHRGKLFFDPETQDRALPDADTPWESLLADVTIFRSYIFEHQAARIHEEGAVTYARRAEPSPVEMTATYYQTSAECVVNVISPSLAETPGALHVVDANGEVVHRQSFTVPGDVVTSVVTLDLSDLPVGDYEVYAQIDDTDFKTERVPFEKVQPDWLGNDLGAGDVVLHPWTPVEVTPAEGGGYVVSVWGRDYTMRGALPASIISRGGELLASPVHLLLDDGSGEQTLAWSLPKVAEATETRVVLTSQTSAAGYTIEATTRIEYDGMLWTELDFTAPHGRTLASMRLEAPIAERYCLFVQYPTLRNMWFPKDEPLYVGFERTPYLFVGNDDAGLQVFTESDQWWHAENPALAMEVSPTADGGAIRFNMVRDAIEMPDQFTIAFGLMATPVRPRPEGWRGWGGNTAYRHARPDTFHPITMGYAWTQTAPGWMIRRTPARADQMLLDRKPPMDGRPGILPFSSTHFMGMRHYDEPALRNFLPEWRQFAPEWLNVPSLIQVRSKPGWNHSYIGPSQSYIDFYCWQFEHMLANTDAPGIYQDGFAGKQMTANQQVGFGYVDRDGSVKGTYPIMAGRELYRRTAAILQRHRGERGVHMVHHGTTLIMPVLSFANAVYDGEFTGWGDIQVAAEKEGIPAGHTEDRIRNILNMRAFGHVPYIDSRNFFRWIDWDVEARFSNQHRIHAYRMSARDMMARYLQSDVQAFFHPLAEDWVRFVMDSWGIADPDVEFLPYWAEQPVATVTDGSRIGGYINHNDGRIMLILPGGRGGSSEGLLRGRGGCEIILDLEQLGLTPGQFRVTDAESVGAMELPVTDNQISLSKQAMEVRFISIEPIE